MKRVTVLDDRWIPWSPDNPVPFDHIPFVGVGKGEARLARELGLGEDEIQGIHFSFDLVDHEGRKWEIKDVTADDRIRMCNGANELAARLWGDLISAGDQIREFMSWAGEDIRGPMMQNASTFVQEQFPKILRGEISRGIIWGGTRMNRRGQYQIISSLATFLRSRPGRRSIFQTFDETFELEIPFERFLWVMSSDLRAKLGPCFTSIEHACAALHHRYFEDPNRLRNDWDGVLPSRAFSGLDRIAFVHRDRGFICVEPKELDGLLYFYGLSQGKVKYGLRAACP